MLFSRTEAGLNLVSLCAFCYFSPSLGPSEPVPSPNPFCLLLFVFAVNLPRSCALLCCREWAVSQEDPRLHFASARFCAPPPATSCRFPAPCTVFYLLQVASLARALPHPRSLLSDWYCEQYTLIKDMFSGQKTGRGPPVHMDKPPLVRTLPCCSALPLQSWASVCLQCARVGWRVVVSVVVSVV